MSRHPQRAAEADEALLHSAAVDRATFASFVAIVFALGAGSSAGRTAMHVLRRSAIVSDLRAHDLTLHYAHEYYASAATANRRPDFPTTSRTIGIPISLVIGMTSQTSDVDICSKVIRRMAAVHGVLSFFFNLVVLALTVNMVANLR